MSINSYSAVFDSFTKELDKIEKILKEKFGKKSNFSTLSKEQIKELVEDKNFTKKMINYYKKLAEIWIEYCAVGACFSEGVMKLDKFNKSGREPTDEDFKIFDRVPLEFKIAFAMGRELGSIFMEDDLDRMIEELKETERDKTRYIG